MKLALDDLPADPTHMTAAEIGLIQELIAEIADEGDRRVAEARRLMASASTSPGSPYPAAAELERLAEAERRIAALYAALVAIERYLVPELRPFDLRPLWDYVVPF